MALGLSMLRAVPWVTLLRQAPALIAAADRLLAASRARQGAGFAGSDLEAVRKQLRALEEEHRHTLEVMKQLADQVAALSSAAHGAEARLRSLQIVAWTATGLALGACALAFVL